VSESDVLPCCSRITKGYVFQVQHLILCHIDASRLHKAAVTPCSVRNKLAHRGYD
jgi:hypothetical protein